MGKIKHYIFTPSSPQRIRHTHSSPILPISEFLSISDLHCHLKWYCMTVNGTQAGAGVGQGDTGSARETSPQTPACITSTIPTHLREKEPSIMPHKMPARPLMIHPTNGLNFSLCFLLPELQPSNFLTFDQ